MGKKLDSEFMAIMNYNARLDQGWLYRLLKLFEVMLPQESKNE